MTEIEALQAAYASEIPAKAAELTRALGTIMHQLGRGEAVSWEDLEYLSHKLCGSSGTYGFKHLAAVAGYLEDRLCDAQFTALAPKIVAEHLAKWRSLFAEQARLAFERKNQSDLPDAPSAIVEPLKLHLKTLLEQRSAA